MTDLTVFIRAKNESQLVAQSIGSLEGLACKILFIDNQSEDDTVELARKAALKINVPFTTFEYAHAVARVGSENKELLARDPESHSLLTNYYNFCLSKIETRFALKWDCDMVAVPGCIQKLNIAVAKGKMLNIRGINYIDETTPLEFRKRELKGFLRENNLDPKEHKSFIANWLQRYTEYEVRLFETKNAIYDNQFWWCEHLNLGLSRKERFFRIAKIRKPMYLHLKLLKHNALDNLSPDYRNAFERLTNFSQRRFKKVT